VTRLATSKIKIGTAFYSCDWGKDEDGRCSTQIVSWLIKSIRKEDKSAFDKEYYKSVGIEIQNIVTIVKKVGGVTYGNKGWNESIDKRYIRRFGTLLNLLPDGIHTTKLKAINDEISSCRRAIKDLKKELISMPNDSECTNDLEVIVDVLPLLIRRKERMRISG